MYELYARRGIEPSMVLQFTFLWSLCLFPQRLVPRQILKLTLAVTEDEA
jgi:hypothetical protein